MSEIKPMKLADYDARFMFPQTIAEELAAIMRADLHGEIDEQSAVVLGAIVHELTDA